MLNSIFINTHRINSAGLWKTTNIGDWPFIAYINWLQSDHPEIQRKDKHVLVDHDHLVKNMPLLKMKTKTPFYKTIIKLTALNLITVQTDEDGKFYLSLTDYCLNIRPFDEVNCDDV